MDGKAAAHDSSEGGVGEKRRLQHLAWDYKAKADPYGDDDYAPTFWEEYNKGDLGPLGLSKWVPEDHPPTHPECKLHDIDCDEVFPWGKPPADLTEPPRRNGLLGDNLVGVFGQDDVVVKTKESGLIHKARMQPDVFSTWPEASVKNRDLLYGSGRQALSDKYFGIGDKYVPLDKAQDMMAPHVVHKAGEGLADLVFGTWNQGFHKPHDLDIRKRINMFDQPYRQHMAVAKDQGQQVFKEDKVTYPTLGDDDEAPQ